MQKNLRDKLGLNVVAVDASERFLKQLAGVTDPETKRKIIGNEFIAVFDDEAHRIAQKSGGVDWLVQGTLYPDVIESSSGEGAVADHQEPSQRWRPAREDEAQADRAAARSVQR